MSLMMSSCWTFLLKRRSALSIDSPSWIFTSATPTYTPLRADHPHGAVTSNETNMVGYHRPARILGVNGPAVNTVINWPWLFPRFPGGSPAADPTLIPSA
jgi:hypothetical protein